MSTKTSQRPLQKVPEVAERLQVTPWRAYELIREGKLKAVRIGRSIRVSPDALEDFISSGGTDA